MSIGSIIIFSLLSSLFVTYLSFSALFYFLHKEAVKNLDIILVSKNPRKRMDIAKELRDLRSKKYMFLIWPALIANGLINGPEKKK